MTDYRVALDEIPDPVRASVLESEVTGNRTIFERAGRPTAILLSWDEYLALRETIDIAASGEAMETIRGSSEELDRGLALLPEAVLEL